jgi:hypothetical protein
MTLERAIKVLTDMGTPDFQDSTENILKARKLGIEALKEIRRARLNNYRFVAVRIPGETNE